MNYPSSINSNVRANKTMFSSNLTLEDIPHRDHKLRAVKAENQANQLQINLLLLCKMVLKSFKVMILLLQ